MHRPCVRASIGFALVALVAACSGSTSSTGVTTIVATTSAPTTAAASPSPTTAAATSTTATVAATTTTAPAPAAAIVPEVVCVDTDRGLGPLSGVTTTVATVTSADASTDTSAPTGSAAPTLPAESLVYFAYRNPADAPVAVPRGDGNRLDGGAAADDPLLPTVFAPGQVSPAFVAIVGTDGALPTWTLRGTDGVVRTAAPTATTPECGSTPTSTPPDTRAPRLAVTFEPTVVGTPAEPKVAVTVRLDGLPATSVCPAGLTALAPVVKFVVNDAPVATDNDGAARAELAVGPLPFATTPANGVRVRTDVFVADRCQGAGAVSSTWATSSAIDALAGTLGATCTVVEGTATRPATADECPVLGATGGIKLRRLPP